MNYRADECDISVNQIQISAIICTHNRANYLIKAIKSLIEQTLSEGDYEIIVVDNASLDDTKQIVQNDFLGVLNLRYSYEPRLGLCYARNTGWKNANGQYVAYLDDDAIACENWLENIISVFKTVKPTPGCVGGRIVPIWESPRPIWLDDCKMGFLAILDWSTNPIYLDEHQYLAGVNFAFPRRLLELIGGFDVRMDRQGKNLLSNGDILAERQIEAKGYRCYYDPHIIVRHHVPVSRLSQKWFVHRAFWQGVSDIKMQQILCPKKTRELLREAIAEACKIVKEICGGYILPTEIYNHLKRMKLGTMTTVARRAGTVHQAIRETVTDYTASLRMRLLNAPAKS